MKSDNDIEVIILSTYSSDYAERKALLNWIATTLQSMIAEQHENTNLIFFQVLKDAPAIYLS